MSNIDIGISIIIPCYNAEPYIGSCLDSILKIENLPVEIICIDDGSTDNTWSILEAYKEKDCRIRLLRQKNLYAGRARNAGLEIARGRYITFIDADDMLHSTATLAKAYEAAVAEDCDILGCGALCGETELKKYNANWVLNKAYLPATKVFSAGEMGCFAFNTFGEEPWSKLYKRSFLEAHQLRFPGLPRTEDIFVVELAVILAEKISYIDEKLIYHRTEVVNSLENTKDQTPTIFWEASKLVYDKMEQLGLFDTYKDAVKFSLVTRALYNLEYIKSVNGFKAVYECVRDEVMPFIDSLGGEVDNAEYKAKFARLKEYFKYSSYSEYIYAQLVTQKELVKNTQYELNRQKQRCEKLKEELHLKRFKKPKVSVIIPAYNVGPYISACLDSILHQSLEELEIICVNDGSKDNTLEILKRYSAMDARIIIIDFKQNKGVSEARNKGAQAATGEYLYFMDGDDLLMPEAMQELYNKAKKEALDVLCFEGTTFFESEELEKRCSWSKQWCVRSREYSGIKTGKQLFVEMIANNDYKCPVWILFFNREFYVKEKLSFATDIKVIEDVLFTFTCIIKAQRAAHSFKKYYVRRVRENSLTSVATHSFKYPYSFFQVAMGIMKLACSLELEPSVAAAANKEIIRMFVEGQRQFSIMKTEEIQKYKNLPEPERVLFECFLLEPFNKEQQLTELQEMLQQKDVLLARAEEKVKVEKQSAIKEAESLAGKYTAKSTELEQIAKQLKHAEAERTQIVNKLKSAEAERTQIANKLKSAEAERTQIANKLKNTEAELKQMVNKLKNTEAELKEATKNLNNVKSGYSFRIGRIFTYLPRLLTGRKY